LPDGLTVTGELPAPCTLDGAQLSCDIGTIEGGYNERLNIPVSAADEDAAEEAAEASEPTIAGQSDSILTNTTFTWDNFVRVFDGSEFWVVLGVTLFYTIFGTGGALRGAVCGVAA